MNQTQSLTNSINRLSQDEMARLRTALETLDLFLMSAPETFRCFVSKSSASSTFLRTTPAATRLLRVLGPEAFGLASVLISLGLQAVANDEQTGWTPRRKIGETFLTLLQANPFVFLLLAGIQVFFPGRYEAFRAAAFGSNRYYDAIANNIVYFGGKRFTAWSLDQGAFSRLLDKIG